MTTRDQMDEDTAIATTSFRERFGGVDTPAALMGMFAAMGVLVFLGALIGAGAGQLTFQLNAFDIEGNTVELAWAGVVAAAVVVFVSFVCGGWVAGRSARYDGGINGLASALWMLLLIAVFAALGAWVGPEYNAFRLAGLPDWFSQFRPDDLTTIGLVGGILGTLAMFAGGYLGGTFGEKHHRRVDAALVESRGLRPERP